MSQLVIGETTQMSARLEDGSGNVLTGRAVNWGSSNDTQAFVSSGGLVSGRANGPVTITATSEGRSGSANLTIVPPVASVTVTPASHTMPVGATVQLRAMPFDAAGAQLSGRAVSWSSSNATVASVSDGGLVTAHAIGAPVTIAAAIEGRTGTSRIRIGNPCSESTPIAIGGSVAGTLTPGDCTLTDGSYADRWRVTLNRATGIQIDLMSDQFDAYLAVTTPDGTLIAFDDNGGTNPNSLLEVTLAAGTYIVWATSYGPGETGQYSLAVTSTTVTGCPIPGTIAIGQTVSGTLETTDCLLYDDTYADGWEFTVRSSTGIVAEMTSGVFDAFVIITDVEGNRLGFDDDGGPGTNSLLRLTLEPGTYRVWANSFYPGQTGPYTLSLRTDACRTAPVLIVGSTVTGALSSEDCRLPDGSFADRWSITLASPGTVRLDLTSEAFDPYLLVTDAANNVIARDDDSGEGDDARIEATLPAGTFVVWANSYTPGQTGAYALAATSVATGPLNLRIDGLYLTQGIQRFSGTVPLVKNRPAYLRVFARASVANTATPAVRVRIYNGLTLLQTLTLSAATGAVPTLLSEGMRDYSWNVPIEGAHIQPGLAIAAEIDPANAIAEADETDNAYPSAGPPKPINVREVRRFDLTLVPIHQSVNGLTGDVNTGNAATYVSLTRRIFPLDGTDVVVRAPYTTTLPALQPDDGNGAWVRLLAELDAVRLAEAPSRSYYGVIKALYGNGLAGLGYIGRPTALGRDTPGSVGSLVAHELGHTFGRFHAPCGGAGGPDPNYPYDDGAIGWYGYDGETNAIIPRTAPDIMGYCGDPWVSDYTYEAVLAFRDGIVPSTQAVREVLLVWGTVEAGKVTLEPAFHLVAAPSPPRKAGPWTLIAHDADGSVLFSYHFDVTDIADGRHPSASFAFTLPADSALVNRIHSLRVTGPPGEASVGLPRGVRRDPTAIPARLAAAERSGSRLTLTWDVRAFPLGLVRDTRTGEILSILRGGRVSITAPGPGLELLLSDGVRTTRQRLDTQ